MKIHIPAIEPIALCNQHLAHGAFDIDLGENVVEVVRCHDCKYAVPLDNNCELNSNVYMHCTECHGEPVNNVWHKYKRYYRDYSIVEHDNFCCWGEKNEK